MARFEGKYSTLSCVCLGIGICLVIVFGCAEAGSRLMSGTPSKSEAAALIVLVAALPLLGFLLMRWRPFSTILWIKIDARQVLVKKFPRVLHYEWKAIEKIEVNWDELTVTLNCGTKYSIPSGDPDEASRALEHLPQELWTRLDLHFPRRDSILLESQQREEIRESDDRLGACRDEEGNITGYIGHD